MGVMKRIIERELDKKFKSRLVEFDWCGQSHRVFQSFDQNSKLNKKETNMVSRSELTL
jgi:hypothetical protein